MLDQHTLFQAAGFGMLLHLVCSALLRSKIDPDSALFDDLFGSPILGDLTKKPWLLRGKYFLPWNAAPKDLSDYSVLPRVFFWGARLGAMLLFLGFIAYLSRIFWEIGHA
jgi:hypothetical protein